MFSKTSPADRVHAIALAAEAIGKELERVATRTGAFEDIPSATWERFVRLAGEICGHGAALAAEEARCQN